jgi:hypothetical protein
MEKCLGFTLNPAGSSFFRLLELLNENLRSSARKSKSSLDRDPRIIRACHLWLSETYRDEPQQAVVDG